VRYSGVHSFEVLALTRERTKVLTRVQPTTKTKIKYLKQGLRPIVRIRSIMWDESLDGWGGMTKALAGLDIRSEKYVVDEPAT
jgi:hypothetical protein